MPTPPNKPSPQPSDEGILKQLLAKVEQLEVRVVSLEQELVERDALIAERDAQIAELEVQITDRDAQIADLKTALFGRKSEKRASKHEEPDPDQNHGAPAKPKSRKARTKAARGPFPDHLPRNVIPCDPPASERVCDCCGKPLVRIGEDAVERLEVIPKRFVVNRYVAGRWACPNRDGQVRQESIPAGLVDRSRYEASVYAMIVAAKYLLHLPLHRLEADFRGQGIELNRSTMWGLVERVGDLVTPIVDQMEREIVAASYLQMDDSFLRVTVANKKGSHKGHIWVIRSGPKVIYRFTMNRNREEVIEMLADWGGGFLQADGHDSFEAVARRADVTRIGCWAHARRLWIKAEADDSVVAGWFLRQIRRAFYVESELKRIREARNLDDQSFFALRTEVRGRITRRIFDAIERRRAELTEDESPPLPKSPTGKALTYLKSQGEPLHNVLVSGELELDNNASERDLRHAVIGRKNWQLTTESKGAPVMARLFSLIVSCKAAGIHPETYLREILPRLSKVPSSDLATLTPWAWAEATGEREGAGAD